MPETTFMVQKMSLRRKKGGIKRIKEYLEPSSSKLFLGLNSWNFAVTPAGQPASQPAPHMFVRAGKKTRINMCRQVLITQYHISERKFFFFFSPTKCSVWIEVLAADYFFLECI